MSYADRIDRFNNLKLEQKMTVIRLVGAPLNLTRNAGPRVVHLYALGSAYVDVYHNQSGTVVDAMAFGDVERINDYLKKLDISDVFKSG
ncbi:MAG: hypothetical protein EOP49_00360 [Sphingobacteriales bacterium]|nr:MAG: hypothetical protein EOP49_00360 [Sphingobacteriales bacterium]